MMRCDVAANRCRVDGCPCLCRYGYSCICRQPVSELQEHNHQTTLRGRALGNRVVNENNMEVRFMAFTCVGSGGTCRYVGTVDGTKDRRASTWVHLARNAKDKFISDHTTMNGYWGGVVYHSESCRRQDNPPYIPVILEGPFQVIPQSAEDMKGVFGKQNLSRRDMCQAIADKHRRDGENRL
jgi:hypothetical protein